MLTLLPWLLLLPMPMPMTTLPDVEPVAVVSAPVAVSEPQQACSPGSFTCVANDDLETFIKLLRDQQCRSQTLPKVTADNIVIVVDRQGRVFGSGTGTKPYTLHLDWCNYQMEIKTELHMDVAQRVEPEWGFRLRVKATAGLLAFDAFKERKLYEALDGGVLVEPFFIRWANVNGYVGFRSVGLGLGADITTNFGAYAGYALTWGTWRSNPFLAVYFAF